jgi:hypothetical protein
LQLNVEVLSVELWVLSSDLRINHEKGDKSIHTPLDLADARMISWYQANKLAIMQLCLVTAMIQNGGNEA